MKKAGISIIEEIFVGFNDFISKQLIKRVKKYNNYGSL